MNHKTIRRANKLTDKIEYQQGIQRHLEMVARPDTVDVQTITLKLVASWTTVPNLEVWPSEMVTDAVVVCLKTGVQEKIDLLQRELDSLGLGGGGATHFGDPCVNCGTPHDDVEPGPCQSLAA